VVRLILAIYRDPRFLTLLCLGFVSGLPFLLTLSTLSFWLSELGVSKSSMGLLMLVGIPYGLKFLWAPFLDHIRIPFLFKLLGQRRSWAIVSLFGLMLSVLALGWSQPEKHLFMTATASFCVSVFSATLDAVIDAYRIELLPREKNAIGASVEAIGFRFGMLTSGAGALYLAALLGWEIAYSLIAASMMLGIVAVLSTKIKDQPYFHKMKRPIYKTFWESWQGLVTQKSFVALLVFIFCFKAPDIVMNAMSAPFFYELGVSKVQFAEISKIFGIMWMVFGALMGGIVLKFLGDLHGLMLALTLQAVSCLMFSVQGMVGYNVPALIVTVGVESFTSGLTSTVFIAYLSKFCSAPHTASHFTLLYSFGSLCRVLTSALSANLAEYLPWPWLFAVTSLVVIPGFYALFYLEGVAYRIETLFKRAA